MASDAWLRAEQERKDRAQQKALVNMQKAVLELAATVSGQAAELSSQRSRIRWLEDKLGKRREP